MKTLVACAALAAVTVLTGGAWAQEQQFAELGDFKLESGQVIRDCKIGYRTYGRLNPERSNAVLWPTWFTGRTQDLAGFIGAGKMLDPDRHFVVTVDALGNGVSSAPSNSEAQSRMQFPKFTIRDMVRSQHELLTKKLGITHLRAVMGISMGGMQTFQWLVEYPEFMDLAIPIIGSPRLTASDRILWEAEAQAIESSTEWQGGEYDSNPKLPALELMHQFALYTPAYRNRTTAPEQSQRMVKDLTAKSGDFDTNNWLRQLQALLAHDIYAGRAPEEVAKTVRAKVLVVVAAQDHMVAPEEAMRFAKLLGTEPLVLAGDCGHMATSCEADTMNKAIQSFLAGTR
jgi:homoserine O-acetyltransferase